MLEQRSISKAGENLVKGFETLRLVTYDDDGNDHDAHRGTLTIGFGHTGPDVVEGLTITRKRAEELFAVDIGECADCVNRNVKGPLTQNEFDALCSFVFNVGRGAFIGSTLLAMLNMGALRSIVADEFLRWNKMRKGSKKVESSGLTRRRKAERAMFLAA